MRQIWTEDESYYSSHLCGISAAVMVRICCNSSYLILAVSIGSIESMWQMGLRTFRFHLASLRPVGRCCSWQLKRVRIGCMTLS